MSRNASFKEELWSAVHCLVGVTSFVTCISADPNDAGMAVGKNVSPATNWYGTQCWLLIFQMFGTDAVRLSQLMITIQNQIVDADDPRSGYLMDGKNTLIYGFFSSSETFGHF